MKTQKKFDSVKMMREIRAKIDSEIMNMTPKQILAYIKQGRIDYEKSVANNQVTE